MKVALYARVSTDKQELDNQLMQLREYAVKQCWEIHYEYTDIISGKETSRPGFDALFLDAHRRLFDVVLFWDFSRFSRSGLEFTLLKLSELKNLGIAWHSYTEPYVNTDNELTRNVVLAVLTSVAKAEREKISDRTIAGLKRRKAEAAAKGQTLRKRGPDKRPRKSRRR